jgi:aerobic-type carbon monoxide dehydrogenase small subunit (CoxS/CutS family)
LYQIRSIKDDLIRNTGRSNPQLKEGKCNPGIGEKAHKGFTKMDIKKTEIKITLNGKEKLLFVGREESLLETLRSASIFSVKQGCDSGDCGVCTVLLDGCPTKSCKIRAVAANGKAITTVEGLSRNGCLHPIQQAFIKTGAIQCGFCTPSQILVAKALLDKNPAPS